MSEVSRRTAVVAGTVAAANLLATGTRARAQQKEEGWAGSAASVSKQSASAKKWKAFTFANVNDLVNFVNIPQAQVAGEVVIARVRPDGAIDCLLFM